MTRNTQEPVTVKLSVERIRSFLSSLPGLPGNLEEKKKMAIAAVEHLDTYYGGSLAENDNCTYKPTLPGIGDIDPCADKPRIPEFGDVEPCASKPRIPDVF